LYSGLSFETAVYDLPLRLRGSGPHSGEYPECGSVGCDTK